MMKENPAAPPPPPNNMATASPGHFKNTVSLSPTTNEMSSSSSKRHSNRGQSHHHSSSTPSSRHHQPLSPLSMQSPSTSMPLNSASHLPSAPPLHPAPPTGVGATPLNTTTEGIKQNVRNRYNTHKTHPKSKSGNHHHHHHHHHHRRRKRTSSTHHEDNKSMQSNKWSDNWCYNRTIVRSTLSCMNLLGKVLIYCSAIASIIGVVWYSYELKNNGTDPHLIAWFSAGAFVLLGFPISIYGIVMHLMNYNQPHVQCYVVRILWMVPIYSIESWLCLRYKNYAIYIETLRDCYESYVLYSFLQFLIEVLGGEDALILMLKDKSPTRGVHMWGLQYCGLKPWLMGQPVRRTYDSFPDNSNNANANPTAPLTNSIYPGGDANPDNNGTHDANASNLATSKRYKRVHWTSPFFVYCKFGVLQYVLLKLVCTFFVLILETFHIYKEGDFTYKGGYLYICTITNLSQCWALYCLIFFYYATKNELGPINPVGKFLAVKALVFFTWWQSLGIAILYQYNLIPYYSSGSSSFFGFGAGSSSNTFEDDPMSSGPLPLSEDAALALDELGGTSLSSLSSTLVGGATSSSGTTETEWTSEDVAKGLQDYLICIEMFVAAIVHVFVFSHTEFDPQAVEARERALHQQPFLQSGLYGNKRLGRKWKDSDNKSAYSGTTFSGNTSGNNNNGGGVNSGLEMVPIPTLNSDSNGESATSIHHLGGDDDLIHPLDRMEQQNNRLSTVADNDNEDEDGSYSSMSSSELNDDDWENNSNYGDNDEEDSEMQGLLASHKRSGHTASSSATNTKSVKRTGFVKALLDSAIPQDLRDNTVGIIKGDYVVERKTLLHHAATSDSYDLFSRVSSRPKLGKKNTVRNQLNMHRATTIGANNAPPTLQEQPRTGTAAGGDPNILLGGLAASSEYAIDKAVQDLA